MNEIIIAAIIVGAIGLLIGILLTIASEKFAITVNEKEIQIREELPGNNCGGCGYPGCDGLAKAIVAGEAKINQCPVGGKSVADAIAMIMGVESEETMRMTAFVRCGGTCENATIQYLYHGIKDCNNAAIVPGGGDKQYSHGCMGYGSCVRECEYNAISIIDGVAVINPDLCQACGKCLRVCPNNVITLIPYQKQAVVKCNSNEPALRARKNCAVSCIGCGICARNCPNNAIIIENSLARIDYTKCTNCGLCKEKCPRKCIITA